MAGSILYRILFWEAGGQLPPPPLPPPLPLTVLIAYRIKYNTKPSLAPWLRTPKSIMGVIILTSHDYIYCIKSKNSFPKI